MTTPKDKRDPRVIGIAVAIFIVCCAIATICTLLGIWVDGRFWTTGGVFWVWAAVVFLVTGFYINGTEDKL